MSSSRRPGPWILIAARPAVFVPALALALSLVVAPRPALARDEGILEVHADLTIGPDGTVAAEETILVWVNGARIRHGISWRIPTRYRDPGGRRAVAAIEIAHVTRDGAPEPFVAGKAADGAALALELGTPLVTLEPGTHVYVLSYRSRGQISLGGERDSLYAPVIAGGRALVINQAAVVVHLSDDTPQQLETLTGLVIGADGAPAEEGVAAEPRGTGAVVTVTRALGAGEGLAIQASWPKGLVRGPTLDEQLTDFLRDNRSFVLALLVWLAQSLFLLGVSGRLDRWRPRPAGPSGEVAPEVAAAPSPSAAAAGSPPDGLSAAALRFALGGRADGRTLAAALLSMVARGELAIARDDRGVLVVSRGDAPSGREPTAGGESGAIAGALFRDGDSLPLEARARGAVAAARRALRENLAAALGERYGSPGGGHLAPAAVFTLAGAVALAAGAPGDARSGTALGVALALVVVLLGVAVALSTSLATAAGIASLELWARVIRGRGPAPAVKRAGAGVAATAALIAIDVLALRALAPRSSWPAALALAAIGLGGSRLARRWRVPTAAGRALGARAAAYRRLLAARLAEWQPGDPEPLGPDRAHAVALELDDSTPGSLGRPLVAALALVLASPPQPPATVTATASG